MATTRSPATSNASPGPSLPARFAVDWPRQEMPPRHGFLPGKSKKGAADRGKTYGRKTEGAAADPGNPSSCPPDPPVHDMPRRALINPSKSHSSILSAKVMMITVYSPKVVTWLPSVFGEKWVFPELRLGGRFDQDTSEGGGKLEIGVFGSLARGRAAWTGKVAADRGQIFLLRAEAAASDRQLHREVGLPGLPRIRSMCCCRRLQAPNAAVRLPPCGYHCWIPTEPPLCALGGGPGRFYRADFSKRSLV